MSSGLKEFSDIRSVLVKGTRMYVSIDSKASVEVMRSSLKAVGADEFAISIPIIEGYFRPLQKNTRVEIYFYKGNGRYYFKTVVTGRIIYQGLPVLKCKIPEKMIKTERRQYYRIDTFIPFNVILTDIVQDGFDKQIVKKTYGAQCIDISGGGMQVDPTYSTKLPVKLGDTIDVDFCGAIPGLGLISCKIVREPKGKKSGWGIGFKTAQDSERDKIIRYVFKKQLDRKMLDEGE